MAAVNPLNEHRDHASKAFNLIMKICFQLSLSLYCLPNFIKTLKHLTS